jgi:hypothetical protein
MANDQRQPGAKNRSQTQDQAQQQGLQRTQGYSPLAGKLAKGPQSHLGGVVTGGGRGLLLAAAGLLLASQAPALAGSVTAESIWDRDNAIQRATSQIPPGATVTGNSCQEVDLRGGSTRYICAVTYASPPPATAPTPAAAPPAAAATPGKPSPGKSSPGKQPAGKASAGANGPSPNAPSAPAP